MQRNIFIKLDNQYKGMKMLRNNYIVHSRIKLKYY